MCTKYNLTQKCTIVIIINSKERIMRDERDSKFYDWRYPGLS